MNRRVGRIRGLAACLALEALGGTACSSGAKPTEAHPPLDDAGADAATGLADATDDGALDARAPPSDAPASGDVAAGDASPDAAGDGGRDYSADRSKFFGASRCATAGVQLCEDFES